MDMARLPQAILQVRPRLPAEVHLRATRIERRARQLTRAGWRIARRLLEAGLASHRVELSPDEARVRAAIDQLFRDAALKPPDISGVASAVRAPEAVVDRMLKLLQRQKVLVKLDVLLFHEEEVTERIEFEDLTKPVAIRKKTVRHVNTSNPFISARHEVTLRQNPRRKGSALYGGYDTACAGKWLNGLRSPRAAPPGWDLWAGLVGAGGEGLSSYYDYDVFEGPGDSRHFGTAARDYQTDALTRRN